MSNLNKQQVLTKLASIFRDVKPFNDEYLESARKNLAADYRELKTLDDKKINDCIIGIHVNLVAFDVAYNSQRNRKAKDGIKILPSSEVANFYDNAQILKSLIQDIEIDLVGLDKYNTEEYRK